MNTKYSGKLLLDPPKLLKYILNMADKEKFLDHVVDHIIFVKFVFVPFENMHKHLDYAINLDHKINICFLLSTHSKHNFFLNFQMIFLLCACLLI